MERKDLEDELEALRAEEFSNQQNFFDNDFVDTKVWLETA